MKALPFFVEVQLYKAQTEAIEALRSGADPASVRLHVGRYLLAISKACRKPKQWHRALRRLQIREKEARDMMRAVAEADKAAEGAQLERSS
jgi:hypothetical protein